eukprot:TRINITY_DN68091_c0_g1_i1.p1 TRINITY_DN68091_c0_g1~~TRINITY_DN68091_c0_g1_i1.p1  ORF type:complete len:733 (-),score=120.28 TRINITY_DN68091_c0_g1_i1:246-2444(-)
MAAPEQWTAEQVKQWAESIQFPDLAKSLFDEDIDGEVLFETDFLSETARKDFNLSWGKAQKFKKALTALKEGSGSLDASSRNLGAPAPQPPVTTLPNNAVRLPVPPAGAPAATAPGLGLQVVGVSPRNAPAETVPQSISPRNARRSNEDIVPLEDLRAIPVVTPIEPGSQASKSNKVDLDSEALQNVIDLMLKQAQDGDIEVAIVSVMGKYRGGKSFLLNLLTHYFIWREKNQDKLEREPRQPNKDYCYNNDMNKSTGWLPEWLPEQIVTPFHVDEKSDTQTCTKGLWILNRPFFLRKPRSEDKIAVLLLDSQGADDGVLNEAQSRAILGITTVFSSTVIYNVKMPLDVKHVKDLSDLANIFQVAIGDVKQQINFTDPEHFSFGRLFFFLRDARFESGATLEQCRAKLAADTANKLDPEKAVVNKERIQQLRDSFQKPFNPPFGLPHPGDAADFHKQRTTSNMRLLNDNFKILLDEFVRASFETNFPVPVNRLLKNKPLTAHSFLEYLERIKEAFSACIVSGGDPELVLMHKEELAEEAFTKAVDVLKPESCERFPHDDLEKLKTEAAERFGRLLDSGLTDDARVRWQKRFKEFMEGHLAQREAKFIVKQGHGDKALTAVGAGLVLVWATPLGTLAAASALWTGVGIGIGTIFGYLRHAHENHMGPERPATIESFAKVTVDRCFDMVKSAKRLVMKLMAFGTGSQPPAPPTNSVTRPPTNSVTGPPTNSVTR